MSKSNSEVNVNLFSGATLLTITFVILKSLGYIDWSWWLVFLPLYGGLALVIGIILVVAVFGLLGVTVAHFWDQYQRKKARKNRKF